MASVSAVLAGKTLNLRIVEKEDLPLIAEWSNNPDFFGEYDPIRQTSRSETEKMLETPYEMKTFIVEKKEGTKIGVIYHYHVLHPAHRQLEIGYSLLPNERGKGYCTEAVRLLVDYLFLSRDTTRIQAFTDPRNLACQKVLEKGGFKKEGILRKWIFIRGELRDSYPYSILREDWKEPKILVTK